MSQISTQSWPGPLALASHMQERRREREEGEGKEEGGHKGGKERARGKGTCSVILHRQTAKTKSSVLVTKVPHGNHSTINRAVGECSPNLA